MSVALVGVPTLWVKQELFKWNFAWRRQWRIYFSCCYTSLKFSWNLKHFHNATFLIITTMNSQIICSIFLNYTLWAPQGVKWHLPFDGLHRLRRSEDQCVNWSVCLSMELVSACVCGWMLCVSLHELWELTFLVMTTRPCKGETGCISNKPVIVSPTSASSSCYTHTLTPTYTHCQGFCQDQRQEPGMTQSPSVTIAAHIIRLRLGLFLWRWRSCSGSSHDQILHKLGYSLYVLELRGILDSPPEQIRLPAQLGFCSSLKGLLEKVQNLPIVKIFALTLHSVRLSSILQCI